MSSGVVPKPRTPDDATRLAIVELLLAGKTFVEVAALVGFHRAQVQMVGMFHGWPDVQRMENSRDALADRIAGLIPAAVEAPKPALKKAPAKRAPRKAKPEVVMTAEQARTPEARALLDRLDVSRAARLAAGTNPRRSSPGSFTDLVERGRASRRVRNRNRAERLVVLAAQLRDELTAEAEGR